MRNLMSLISKSIAIILYTTHLIWKTSAPNAIYTVRTGDVTPTHWEHESHPCLVCQQWHNIFFFPANTSPFRTADVSSAPGAGANKSGSMSALCGSTQIREELFIRDCGVLSFTTAYFPSFHHAAIEPTLPRIFPVRPGQKHGFECKY